MEYLRFLVSLFLHLDRHLGQLINIFGAWSYLLLFLVVFCETGLVVTPFLPGDSLLFVVGAFTSAGYFDFFLIGTLLMVAAICGDSINYALGLKLGPKIFATNPRLFKPEYLEKTQQFYQKHGNATIILARFVPIVRTFAPFVAGVGKMQYFNFMLYNVVGGIVWVWGLLALGYFFGHLPIIKNNLSVVIIAIVVLSILPALLEICRNRWGRGSEKKILN